MKSAFEASSARRNGLKSRLFSYSAWLMPSAVTSYLATEFARPVSHVTWTSPSKKPAHGNITLRPFLTSNVASARETGDWTTHPMKSVQRIIRLGSPSWSRTPLQFPREDILTFSKPPERKGSQRMGEPLFKKLQYTSPPKEISPQTYPFSMVFWVRKISRLLIGNLRGLRLVSYIL